MTTPRNVGAPESNHVDNKEPNLPTRIKQREFLALTAARAVLWSSAPSRLPRILTPSSLLLLHVVWQQMPVLLSTTATPEAAESDFKEFSFSEGGPKAWFVVIQRLV
jgi:hypothetical protein